MKKIIKTVLYLFVITGIISSCKKEKPYDPHKQLEIDEGLIKAYIADSIPAVRHSSGVYYVIGEQGNGDTIVNADTEIKAKYSLRLMNGPVITPVDTITFRLGDNIIEGWKIGVPLISEEGKIRLFLPSGWAYGPYRKGNIPPNSILDFKIEMIKVDNK